MTALIPPRDVKKGSPSSDELIAQVQEQRKAIQDILDEKDDRLLAIVGPCSIHDPDAALEYARELKRIADDVSEQVLVVMRLYFAKPRTTVGWKGLFYDPELTNHREDVNDGARKVRELTHAVASLGLPVATEVLDPYMIHYIDDLVSWSCIGARTVESQLHRELASGLPMPVGVKNGSDGRTKGAVDAVEAANYAHGVWGMDDDGRVSRTESSGNPYAHVVLRGGDNGPNYDAETINATIAALKTRDLKPALVVDCAHGNSQKIPERQREVLESVLQQRSAGNRHLIGFMLESNIVAGKQDIGPREQLRYGQSITDPCIDIAETETLLHEAVQQRTSKAAV